MGMSCFVSGTSAAAVGRSPPQLVAHVLVAVTEDRRVVLAAGHQMLDFYAKIPFYTNMFSNADFSLTSDQAIPDTPVDSLVISGNESIVADRLAELLDAGLGEVMVFSRPTTGAGDDESSTPLSIYEYLADDEDILRAYRALGIDPYYRIKCNKCNLLGDGYHIYHT
jgi:hypothetical protein